MVWVKVVKNSTLKDQHSIELFQALWHKVVILQKEMVQVVKVFMELNLMTKDSCLNMIKKVCCLWLMQEKIPMVLNSF